MKKFLLKYRWSVITCLVLFLLTFIWEPRQSDYYLAKDIQHFKSSYITPILIVAFFSICLLLFLIIFYKSKSIIKALDFLYVAPFAIGPVLILSQGLVLATALFVNRQFEVDKIKHQYIAGYIVGEEKNKQSFIPMEIDKREISSDEKLIDLLYKPGLKDKDTVRLDFSKGLFGIEYLKTKHIRE